MTKHLSLYEILLSLRSDDFATLDPEELAEVTAELSPEERAKVHAWLQERFGPGIYAFDDAVHFWRPLGRVLH